LAGGGLWACSEAKMQRDEKTLTQRQKCKEMKKLSHRATVFVVKG
jgi:hypothetical protein